MVEIGLPVRSARPHGPDDPAAQQTTAIDDLYGYVRDSIWWYTTDEEITLTPEIATEVMIEASDPRSSHFRQMRHQDMRPEHLFGRRMEMLTLAVLGQLRSRNNWHRIAREWMYEDEPVTELGRAEAAFYARTPA